MFLSSRFFLYLHEFDNIIQFFFLISMHLVKFLCCCIKVCSFFIVNNIYVTTTFVVIIEYLNIFTSMEINNHDQSC